MRPRIGSLCSGFGGLDCAVQAVLGGSIAWHSEIDPAASKVLAHHWDVPNHGDLTVMDWSQVEPVDVLTAGFPCQPWSTAGKRRGVEDERAIWPDVARAVRDLRPRFVVLENIAAIAPAGELARVAGDLAACGYVGSWRCIRASDVGAPHQRRRIFILAADTSGEGWGLIEPVAVASHSGTPLPAGETQPGRWDSQASTDVDGCTEPGRVGDAAANTDHELHGEQRSPVACPQASGERGDQGADRGLADRDRGGVDWAGYAPAIERWERVLGRPAPAPTVLGARGGRQLSARFVEWLMGLPAGWVCDVPDLTRNQQLKLLGNGVIPLQAEAALRHLLASTEARCAA